ncbi:MAG: hypothetical protein M1837_000062 [Sclerophora amabilis]|nr:MAG: hypothetical protein M1837_000062 [Sclerophora amabilis]
MSAEALGRRLVEEVKEESLSEVLKSLRALNNIDGAHRPSPAFAPFGVPPLDQLLKTPNAPISHPPTIHLQGPPSSGKTSLIYYLITILTLPESFLHPYHLTPIPLHGHSSAVIVLDNDSRFSATRLQQIIKGYITQRVEAALRPHHGHLSPSGQHPQPVSLSAPSLVSSSTNVIDILIITALTHTHIIRPTSTASLQATLQHSLPEYLLHANHPSQHRRVGAIILDSADAFTWQDKLDAITKNSSTTTTTTTTTTNPTSPTQTALRSLQRLLSNPLLLCTSSTSSFPSFAHSRTPGMPKEKGDLTIRLERVAVPKFGPGMSLEEAEVDRERRAEVVRRGVFEARVGVWGRWDGGDGGTRGGGDRDEGWEGIAGRGRREVGADAAESSTSSVFRFWIRGEGIGILNQ